LGRCAWGHGRGVASVSMQRSLIVSGSQRLSTPQSPALAARFASSQPALVQQRDEECMRMNTMVAMSLMLTNGNTLNLMENAQANGMEGLQAMNRNNRRPKKANRGKRPCSRFKRSKKKPRRLKAY